MAKEALKERARAGQNGKSAKTGAPLPVETRLFDTHRRVPKREGGTYDPANFEVDMPVEHMEEHGTLRELPPAIAHLKALIDDREQLLKLRIKVENQLLAYERQTDHAANGTEDALQRMLAEADKLEAAAAKKIEVAMRELKDMPLVAAMDSVVGLGPMTQAYCLVYLDPTLAKCASAYWKYTGLHCASHERYTKGEASGGNKKLRTALYRMADSMMKNADCPYRKVYDDQKARRAASEAMVKSRNTQGLLVTVAWKDAKPSHRHGDALRAMMKHFLADLWFVSRTLAGLDTRPLYVEEKLGHTGIVAPRDRGWKF